MRAEKFLSILKGFAECIFTASVFVFLPIIFITLVSSRTSLFGLQSFTVLSGSMTPLIPVGSVVYTLPGNDFQVNDIITFKRGNINVTHRIIDTVDKDGKHISPFVSPISKKAPTEIFYKTKGDANNAVDSDLVPKSQIIGKTMTHLPSIGRFASFIKSVPGFLSLVVLPTIMFVGFELWNIKKEIEKSVEKRTIERFGAL